MDSSPNTTVGVPFSHPYTCNTCQVGFRNNDLHKGHLKSDWHRYNLKRRITTLPPITFESFNERVTQARMKSALRVDQAQYSKLCIVCQKTYSSENAYQNHLQSARHQTNAAAPSRQRDAARHAHGKSGSLDATENASSDSDEDMAPDDHEASLPSLQVCLFCNYSSPTPRLSVIHMERIHGMFIPEKQYLVDQDGLMRYLQELVHKHRECITCGKVKKSVHAVQTHMRDKAHCRIPYTSEKEQLEIGEFYDFRSSYEDKDVLSRDEEEGAKDGHGGGEDDGWETDSTASSLATEDLTAVPAEQHYHQYARLGKHRHHSRHDPRHHHQADGWHSHAHKHTYAVFHDDFELYLPSGKSVGHRAHNRYYRQNLHRYPSAQERAEQAAAAATTTIEDANNAEMTTTMNVSVRGTATGALIDRGMSGVSDAKKAEVKKEARRTETARDRRDKRHQLRIQMRRNNHTHERVAL